MKLDILVLSAHPDDAELGCSGTLLAAMAQGKKVGIVDLTRGELGSRGTPEIRAQEAAAAAKVLGLHARENLGLPDGFFRNEREHQLPIIGAVRRYQPDIVLLNAVHDRHPDHGRGSQLESDACFLAGLKMIETLGADGQPQEAWRPKQVYHFIQDRYIKPDFVVDITPHWAKKREAIAAFASQFNVGNDGQPHTYISSPEFWHFLEARAREMGHIIGVEFGEGFTAERALGVRDLSGLL
ncbi:bacillithiol biosynthesis deacetylase BshB1 [Hymenobacter oligotrophus]|uniref:Bacillithiol biosynthesis deacetylase BshB1 n=1 Tax=Hymenobacter oligotrophus TaxID=2319843 RepID=A0A3B7QX57_9BACT|nr:bacillithiol biosynthesis deacetylase BshB1 [Hymenobacter oligotrophus]AYA36394.1 bacillithiol biosynthesis deacetylase BshB1 [Hymenobacter oligotrophus]